MGNKYTVTEELTVRRTYELDLDTEAWEFAKGDLDEAVQTAASQIFDEPAAFVEDENVRFSVRVSVKDHGKHNVIIEDDDTDYGVTPRREESS